METNEQIADHDTTTPDTPPTTTIVPTPTSLPDTTPMKKSPWLVVVIVITLVGVAGYLWFQNNQLKQQLVDQQPTPTPQTVTSSPSPMTNATANWNTYANTRYNYQIKYPTDWTAKSVEPGPPAFELVGDSRGFIVYPDIYSGVADAKAYITIETDGPQNTAFSSYEDWVSSVSKSTFFNGVISQGTFANQPVTIATSSYDGYGFPATIKTIYFKTSDGSTYYSVTATVEQNSAHSDTVTQILSTFQFTK